MCRKCQYYYCRSCDDRYKRHRFCKSCAVCYRCCSCKKEDHKRDSRCKHKNKDHDLHADTLKVKNIVPTCTCSAIGSSNNMFDTVYTDDMYLGRDRIHFGKDVKLITRNGEFYCDANGSVKKFQYELSELPTGPKGDRGEKGDRGDKGDKGGKGEKGEKGDSSNGPMKLKNNVLIADTIRDVPSAELCQLFFNPNTNEVSYDSTVLRYSELIETVNNLQKEVDELKAAQN
jgi:hypothetical protein